MLSFFDFKWFEFNAKIVSIPDFGEIIGIIDHTISTEDVNMSSNIEILRLIVLFFLKSHARVYCIDSLFG